MELEEISAAEAPRAANRQPYQCHTPRRLNRNTMKEVETGVDIRMETAKGEGRGRGKQDLILLYECQLKQILIPDTKTEVTDRMENSNTMEEEDTIPTRGPLMPIVPIPCRGQ